MNQMADLRSCVVTACCGAETIGALDDCKETNPLNHDGDEILN